MEANQYQNALELGNTALAERINQDAITLVRKATPALIRTKQGQGSLHGPETDGRYNSHYLSDALNEIMQDLYGVVCPNVFMDLKDVPQIVTDFVREAQPYRQGIRFGQV